MSQLWRSNTQTTSEIPVPALDLLADEPDALDRTHLRQSNDDGEYIEAPPYDLWEGVGRATIFSQLLCN